MVYPLQDCINYDFVVSSNTTDFLLTFFLETLLLINKLKLLKKLKILKYLYRMDIVNIIVPVVWKHSLYLLPLK